MQCRFKTVPTRLTCYVYTALTVGHNSSLSGNFLFCRPPFCRPFALPVPLANLLPQSTPHHFSSNPSTSCCNPPTFILPSHIRSCVAVTAYGPNRSLALQLQLLRPKPLKQALRSENTSKIQSGAYQPYAEEPLSLSGY